MKKIFLLSAFIVFSAVVFSQAVDASRQGNSIDQSIPAGNSGQVQSDIPNRVAVNVGVLMGGGSLVGADFEYMPSSRVGIQAGMGISSYGFGLNYHLKNRINSSFVTVQYWNQGFGDNHYASYVGPMFVFRAKKIFQAGIGLAAILDKGPRFKADTNVNAVLLYNIGVYFPL